MTWIEHLQSANWFQATACLLGAYLLGCLATGYYLVRARTGRDIARVAASMPDELMNPKGAELLAFSAVDGSKLGSLPLDSPPAFDGLAAAGGRLYLSIQSGQLLCLSGKKTKPQP